MRRAAFLDRDGVINRKPPEDQYVTCWQEMHVLSNVPEAILLLNQAGFHVIVVTNQRCIALGLVSAANVEAMHQRICEEFAAKGAIIDEVYYCPHDTNLSCSCRKPSTGMLMAAAHKRNIDLSASWMIGDSSTDIEAGKNAGCRTARVLTGDEIATSGSDVVGSSLLDTVHKLLRWDQISAAQHANNTIPEISVAWE